MAKEAEKQQESTVAIQEEVPTAWKVDEKRLVALNGGLPIKLVQGINLAPYKGDDYKKVVNDLILKVFYYQKLRFGSVVYSWYIEI